MSYTKTEKAEALAKLREWIKPGDTVYTILRNVSRSGMSREIGVVLLANGEDGRTIDLHPNYSVAVVLGERCGKRDGVIVGGAGMDMGFHLVYSLSSALFPNGYGCIGKGCASNDHSNGDRNYIPHSCGAPTIPEGLNRRQSEPAQWTWEYAPGGKPARVMHWHKDGGYALRHRWL